MPVTWWGCRGPAGHAKERRSAMANGRYLGPVTYEVADKELRRYAELYPDSPPEVAAMGLMWRIDSWEEHAAILKALDAFLAERS